MPPAFLPGFICMCWETQRGRWRVGNWWWSSHFYHFNHSSIFFLHQLFAFCRSIWS